MVRARRARRARRVGRARPEVAPVASVVPLELALGGVEPVFDGVGRAPGHQPR